MEKLNCYKCKYRRRIPGDAHSKCSHPDADIKENKLNIEANYHGIRNGWFYWPLNFDPVWLENCDGFEKRES